ncbi:DUF1929 domain-containing protein [Chitinophagaceae bacterium 26-R-25]|nr:DUF1929 domain-containing protein [Chitinophagaceae bacterium 26-R-25]
MSWLPVISSENVVAIHAILVPTLNGDGEVLIVGGDNHSYAGNNPGAPHDYLNSRRFNCRTTSMISTPVPTPDFDLFCCGHAFLGDGRPLLAGGTAQFPADATGIHHTHHFDGHRHSTIYSYLSGVLNQAADMNPEPGLTTGGGRWYPTLCTLGTGDVFIFQGHPEGDDNRHGNNTPERYQLAGGNWVLLPAIGVIGGDPILYPRIHLINDGKIFVSSFINGFTQNIKINPFDGTTQNICSLPDGAYNNYDFPSVLLPLSSSDGYAARILLCGGATSQIINLSDASPSWSTVRRDGNPSGGPRVHSCATLLPTGHIILNGGTSDGNDVSAVNDPEIYDPNTNQWTTLNDPASVLRNYHSSALLMPDGNIWTGGGNLVVLNAANHVDDANSQPRQPPTANQEKIEVFVPPYPPGTRPVIVSCPASVSFGKTIQVETNNGSIIQKVVLMRCGSSTHAFNPDQRAINLDFTVNGNTINAVIPSNPNVVVPGPYMLFTVDNGGRPCEYARFIRIGYQSCEIITDHSTFSILEVDAQPAGSAIFQNAFYVVYDGFLPSELNNFTAPPVITFAPLIGGSNITSIRAIHADTKFENPTIPTDIPQKVTFVFNVLFTNDSAFGFSGQSEDVRITANLLQNTGHAVINLTKTPNPYMVDGPMSWLSVDLRVFQMKEGGPSRVTISQGSSGTTFITQLLNRFNDRTIYPADELHPFYDIDTDQETSQLEWLETSGGTRVFNYAVAKVRFKAPIPTPPSNVNDATNVKVFFRLFNTAGTAMQYNPAKSYNRSGSGVNTIALVGKEGGIISSIPFFAASRVNYNTSLMASQTDPLNMKTLPAKGNVESVAYFGCWLDFNQPAQMIPVAEDATHATSLVNLQTSIRGIHQCLVAEVYFEGDPTPINATPASNDNLSQRNLAISHSDNPGNLSTHTVQHTFEIKPSQFTLSVESINDRLLSLIPRAEAFAANERKGPDLLMIHWNNLPLASKVIVYTPDIKVDDILALEPYTRISTDKIVKEDEYSFSFSSSQINYIPIPGGFEKNIPGLLTIELPDNVVKGQLFKVLVQQARFFRNTRYIIGSFQFNVVVRTAVQILQKEMRNLSILKYVRQAMAVTDPWRFIFNRYIKSLSDKIDGLGGDAAEVPPAPNDKWLLGGEPKQDGILKFFDSCCRKMSFLMMALMFLLLLLFVLMFIKLI